MRRDLSNLMPLTSSLGRPNLFIVLRRFLLRVLGNTSDVNKLISSSSEDSSESSSAWRYSASRTDARFLNDLCRAEVRLPFALLESSDTELSLEDALISISRGWRALDLNVLFDAPGLALYF